MASLRLASLNVRGLRDASRKLRVARDLQRLGVDICCIQETHFIPSDYQGVLLRDFQLYSAHYDTHARGVTWLVKRTLDASCDPIYADPEGRLLVLDVTVKDVAFRFIGVYAPNNHAELVSFFRRIEPFMNSSRRLVLAGDWNAVLDPELDRGVNTRRDTNQNRDAKAFRDFVDKFDLVDKFRNEKPGDLA